MNAKTTYILLILAGLLGSSIISGCRLISLLYDVSVAPQTITPDADGIDDVTRISYKLSRSANVSIFFMDETGNEHYFRQNRRRSAGNYGVDFGGVIKGTMLPDGPYTWVISAVDDYNKEARLEGALNIQNVDVEQPQLERFSLHPQQFTPNQDGIDDYATISYFLTKESEVKLYLISAEDGNRYPVVAKENNVEANQLGFHTFDYDGGVNQGASPPPDGTYTLWAEAVDRVGNRTHITKTLTIAEGGVPRVEIVNAIVDFYNPETGDRVVPLGQTLAFTLTVKNFGAVPLRTIGPTSGEHYVGDENFKTKGFPQSPGAWQVGIDYETNPDLPYPYRWSIGNVAQLEKRELNGKTEYFLMPGKRAIVTGSIQIVDIPAGQKDVIEFWAGLLQDNMPVESSNDRIDSQLINIGF